MPEMLQASSRRSVTSGFNHLGVRARYTGGDGDDGGSNVRKPRGPGRRESPITPKRISARFIIVAKTGRWMESRERITAEPPPPPPRRRGSPVVTGTPGLSFWIPQRPPRFPSASPSRTLDRTGTMESTTGLRTAVFVAVTVKTKVASPLLTIDGRESPGRSRATAVRGPDWQTFPRSFVGVRNSGP